MTSNAEKGEDLAAEFLVETGFEIVCRNWRDRFCEIDIVAKKDKCIHIVEVKYRQDNYHGYGYEFVDKTKQRRLLKAAQRWTQANRWKGDIVIDVISIDGQELELTYIENAVEMPLR